MPKLNNRCRNYPRVTELLENEIYARRRAMGISQYTLAEEIGVSRNCIQQMECHEHIPKMETVVDIMMVLGFSTEERNAFAEKYMDAYSLDKKFQKEQEQKLAGIV